jgi:anti-anti-sigma factor
MKFAHELHIGADSCRLILHGEIDMAVSDELHAILQQAVALSSSVTEVDLGDVTFLDCTGIGVLVAANNTARRHGRAVYVSHASRFVRRVLEITDVLPHLSAPAPSPTQPVTTARYRSPPTPRRG